MQLSSREELAKKGILSFIEFFIGIGSLCGKGKNLIAFVILQLLEGAEVDTGKVKTNCP
jgi:hypothetical protein